MRKAIYWELILANYESSDQADRDFPDPPLLPYDQAKYEEVAEKRGVRFDELWEQWAGGNCQTI